ncbi:MAG: DUF4861 family protein [Cellvibrionaceae bacterium]|nr:DUF4861 family protein [Cellvibrionaceae bacterium]
MLTLISCSPGGETENPQRETQANPKPEVITEKQAPSTLVASIEVTNPSTFVREKSPLYFSYAELGLTADSAQAKILAVKNADNIVQSQAIDNDSDGAPDGLAIAVDLNAKEVVNLAVVADATAAQTSFPSYTQAEISHKEGGQWVAHTKSEGFKEYVGGNFINVEKLSPPAHYTDHSNWIRYEGPGIESDKVGYRVYLDWRNGFDIFGKKVSDTILQGVGQDGYDSYHEMQTWGLDILKVGSSLGAGAFGRWDGKKIHAISKVSQRTASITNNGPIYSSFNIAYRGWEVNDKTLDISSEISMVAGSRLARNRLTFSDTPPTLVVGVVKHPDTEFIASSREVPGDAFIYIASWGKQALSEDMLGMAVFIRKRDAAGLVEAKSSYATAIKTAGNIADYYFAAAWQGEHNKGVATKEAFVDYLNQVQHELNQPPRIRLKTALSQQAKAQPMTAEQALGWSKKLADSELKRKTLKYYNGGWDTNRRRVPVFEYDIIGILPTAYDKLAEVTGDAKYAEVLPKITGSFIGDDGSIAKYSEDKYNIDWVAPGVAVLRLYKRNQEEKYKIAASHLRQQLENHPRTSEGAFWHKKKYPWQLWLDGVYMGMPFFAEYLSLFENGEHLEEVVKEFTLTRKYLRAPETGLYYHAWDEKKQQPWADKETGLSAEHWGRGMGWLSMAVVDVLDFLPQDQPELRKPLLDITEEIAATLVKYIDSETNTWWQVLDKPNHPGNYRESTASAMFTYFFAKAVNKGYLPEPYKQVALDAYQGLINEFINVHPDGSISMTNQCLVAGLGFGRLGDYDYYMKERVFQNDPKGNGPFIFSGIEIYHLLK